MYRPILAYASIKCMNDHHSDSYRFRAITQSHLRTLVVKLASFNYL